MILLCSVDNASGLARLVLQPETGGGVQVFAFAGEASGVPEWDYWLEDLDEAKAFCLERWGAPLDSWRPAPDEPVR